MVTIYFNFLENSYATSVQEYKEKYYFGFSNFLNFGEFWGYCRPFLAPFLKNEISGPNMAQKLPKIEQNQKSITIVSCGLSRKLVKMLRTSIV